MNIHKSVTLSRVLAAAEDEMFGMGNAGFCLACGEEADGCEPDARKYHCESCDKREVYGASEVMIMIG